jgi:hypothetical protein
VGPSHKKLEFPLCKHEMVWFDKMEKYKDPLPISQWENLPTI